MSSDLLVIGGGVAGAATAAHAASAGANVTVLEKDERLGGSGALSAGILWTAPDMETLRRVMPRGNHELGRMLVEGFDDAVERVRAEGIEVSERWYGQMGFGVAHRIDIHGLLELWRERISASGRIEWGTAATGLIVENGRVVGARTSKGEEVRAGGVVLATGGFQGDSALLRRYIGEGAERLILRSNPHSTGDGLRFALDAGATTSDALDSFYGHMLPSPLRRFTPDDYLPLTQYHSKACVVVNFFGRRFSDEARGDEVTNQALLRQPGARGVLLCDEAVRREHVIGAPYPHGQVVDRFELGRAAGARMATADTIEELVERVEAWGVNGPRLAQTLADVEAVANGEEVPELDAPLTNPVPLREPPFHATEVQPAITFTFGGVRTDADGHALDSSGQPVPGLYAVGADMGGLQENAYIGGLVLGLIFGPRVAEAALNAPTGRKEVANR